MPKGRPRKTPLALVKVTPTQLFWRWHQEDEQTRRIWRMDWFGDQFDVISAAEFADIERVMKKFSIPVIQAADDED